MVAKAPRNPLDSPTDKVRFAGRIDSPGIAEIIGASSPRKWEEWTAGGWSGGVLFFRGLPLSHFSIRLYLYDSQDWADWHAFRPLVMRPPAGQFVFPKAIDVSHPFLADLGITAVVLEDVRAPDQVDHGVWMIELMVIEHRSLRAGASGKVDAAEAAPIDPVEQRIKDLEGAVLQRKAERDRLLGEGNLPPV